jgi:hypothetical protein
MNAGEKTIDWLFRDQLAVDAEWSIRTPNGFRWWAHRNQQIVELVGQETGPDGEPSYLISVRTYAHGQPQPCANPRFGLGYSPSGPCRRRQFSQLVHLPVP